MHINETVNVCPAPVATSLFYIIQGPNSNNTDMATISQAATLWLISVIYIIFHLNYVRMQLQMKFKSLTFYQPLALEFQLN